MVTNAQGVASIQEATGTQAAIGRDSAQWAIRSKSPRWDHAKGGQNKGEPSPPAPCH